MFTEDEVLENLRKAGFEIEEKFTDHFKLEGFGVEGFLIKNVWEHRTNDVCIFADQKGNWDKLGNSNLNLKLPADNREMEKLILMLKIVGKDDTAEFYEY